FTLKCLLPQLGCCATKDGAASNAAKGDRERAMAERSQASSDFDGAVQDGGVGIKAANGGSPLPPLIAPEMNDAPLAPANNESEPAAGVSNGSAEQAAPGNANEINISVAVDASQQGAQPADGAQVADGAMASPADASFDPDFHDMRVIDIKKGQLDCRGGDVRFI